MQNLWSHDLSPYLGATAPVLELKHFAWHLCGALIIPVYAFARIFESATKVSVFPKLRPSGVPGVRFLRLGILFSALAFLVWSVVTLVYFGPAAPEDAAQGITGSGGFFHSISALGQVTFALIFFVVLEDMLRERRLAYKMIGLMIGIGILCSIVAFLQQIEPAWFKAIWVQFDESDTRNNYGSFIGHNTGLSSFLIAPMLLSIGILAARFEKLRRKWRILLSVGIFLFAYALILAQSRAVIPILSLVIGVFLRAASRREKLYITRRWVAGAIVATLLLITSQLIVSERNPFARTSITLVQRFKDVSYAHILADTRVRIFAICAPRVLDKPITGYGFGSFQYIYPEQQKNYFERYPDSKLMPWARRSFHAHNEYLQTGLETGFTGLVIACFGVGCLLRLGFLMQRATLSNSRLVLQWAILMGVVAYLLHAFVDFPLRVPPIALYFMALLALWSAGERLWLTPIEPPRGIVEEQPPPISKLRPAAFAGVALVATTLLAGVAMVSALGAARLSARWYSGRVIENSCNALLKNAQENLRLRDEGARNEGFQSLDEADFLAREAMYYLPLDGDVLFVRGRIKTLRGELGLSQARMIARDGNMQGAKTRFDLAHKDLETALNSVTASLAETCYQSIYIQRAAIFSLLASSAADIPERNRALEASLADLRMAYAINPGETDAAGRLVRMLDQRGTAEDEIEIRRVLRVLRHFVPSEFRRIFYLPVLDCLTLGDYPTAYRMMRRIKDVSNADDVEFLSAYATVATRTSRHQEAREMIAVLMRRSGNDRTATPAMIADMQLSLAVISAREGQFASALEVLQNRVEGHTRAPEAITVAFHAELLRRLDRQEEAARFDARLEELFAESTFNIQLVGAFMYETFSEPTVALPFLERRIRISDPAADLQTNILLARCYAALGREEDLGSILPRVSQLAVSPSEREIVSRFVRSVSPSMQNQTESGDE
jgi:tetratricopeptide (TPR) repeat protein